MPPPLSKNLFFELVPGVDNIHYRPNFTHSFVNNMEIRTPFPNDTSGIDPEDAVKKSEEYYNHCKHFFSNIQKYIYS